MIKKEIRYFFLTLQQNRKLARQVLILTRIQMKNTTKIISKGFCGVLLES